jgi:hypothetical protein
MSNHTSPRDGAQPPLPSACRIETLGVAFFDLSRFGEWSSSDEDVLVVSFLQDFYELAAKLGWPSSPRKLLRRRSLRSARSPKRHVRVHASSASTRT